MFGIDDNNQQQHQEKPPSIFITSHEPGNSNLLDDIFGIRNNNSSTPLTVRTQNLHCNSQASLGSYDNQLQHIPSPNIAVSDDELDNANNSLYGSTNSPHTPVSSTHRPSNSYSSTTSPNSY
jgi:hypothetical protein